MPGKRAVGCLDYEDCLNKGFEKEKNIYFQSHHVKSHNISVGLLRQIFSIGYPFSSNSNVFYCKVPYGFNIIKRI